MRRAPYEATAPGPAAPDGILTLQADDRATLETNIARMAPLVEPGAWTFTDRETSTDGQAQQEAAEGRPDDGPQVAADGPAAP